MPKKLLIAGLLTTIAAIALGAVYFGFSRKENTMEQTYIESTNVPPTGTPTLAHTENTNIPPIDASAPTHIETATFAMG